MQFSRFALLCGSAILALAALTTAQDGPPPLPEGTTWQSTDSGLRYAVIEPGSGDPTATLGDKVTAHYTGWLKDGGKQFDSSKKPGRGPFSFSVGSGVIQGWSEGIQLMPVGATYRFEIPAALGYGDRGAGSDIPGGATLLFDIELLDVKVGPKPHPLVAPTADKQITLEEGIVYEIIEPGDGKPPSASDEFTMHYSIYLTDGTLYQSSKIVRRPIMISVDGMPAQFPAVLKKMPLAMKPGMLCRVEASSEKGLGADAPAASDGSIWILEMVKPLDVPQFDAPADSQLESSESGLKWKVIKPGDGGATPEPTDEVTVHYAGRLTSGAVFDSSYSRGEPSSFPLNRVIPGWTEGVGMMTPGEIRIFVIPGDLAYGPQGSPPNIGPNETLVFWVELISID